MKKITFWFLALFSCAQIQAQVSYYTFAQSNETYTEITGGTVLGTATTSNSFDGQNWAIASGSIPFNFNFNGIDYTGCNVNSNGFITFGTTLPGVFTSTPLSSPAAYSGAVSAWGGDLNAVFIPGVITSETRWEVVGTAPNRELVVQFKNWRPSFDTDVNNVTYINFQIRLVETSNQIKIVYGTSGFAVGSSPTQGLRQIGLRGASNADFINRTNTDTQLFTASTAGALNNSRQAYHTSLATPGMPTNGLVYTFVPPISCTDTPVAGAILPETQNVCVGDLPADLVVSGFSSGVSGLAFQWETSTDGNTWSNAIGISATTAVYDTPSYVGGVVYYRCKVTCYASTLFSFTNVVTINPPANPTEQATNLSFTNITYNGFTANWTNATGNRRVVYISDAPIVDPISGSGAALVAATIYGGSGQQIVYDGVDASVSVTGLTISSQYYVKVIEYVRCGTATPFDYYYNTVTDTNANTVTTSLPTQVPPTWQESFTTSTVPSNWVTTGWSLGAIAALNEGSDTFFLRRLYAGTTTTGEFSTPIFATIPANYRLAFTYKLANSSSPYAPPAENSGNIIVAISTDNGATYSNVDFINNNGIAGWQVYTFNLSSFVGQTIRIRITTNMTTGSYYAGFDNFKIEPVPTCLEPTNLNVSFITNESALLGWNEEATATTWEIQYGTVGFTLGSGVIVEADENPYTLVGLNDNTNYSFYVRAVCSDTDQSPWTGPFTFKTDCDTVTDYIETFGIGGPVGSSNPIVDCFTKGGNGLVYLQSSSSFPMSGNRLIMTANPQATPVSLESYVSLKPVSNLSAGTHRLRFKAYMTALASFLEIGYFSDNVFVPIHQVDVLPGLTSTQQYIFAPEVLPLGVERLVFRFTNLISPTAVSATINIDDVIWEAIPTCLEPSEVTITDVLATTSTLSWTAPSQAPLQGYEYYLSIVGTEPGANPDSSTPGYVALGNVGVGVTTTSLTTLPTTVYYVWVRSVCSTTDKSLWTFVMTFTTPCAAEVPDYTQDFNSSTAIPTCWNKYLAGTLETGPTGSVNGGPWLVKNYLNTSTTPINRAANISITGVAPSGKGWLVSPIFDLTAGGYQIQYKVGVTGIGVETAATLGSDDAVHLLMSIDAGVTWTNLATYTASNTPSNLGQSEVITIPTVTSNAVKFAFYGTNGIVSDTSSATDFFIDDFVVQNVLSTGSFDSASFKYYPNPVTDVLTLSYSNIISSVVVYNLLGQQMLFENPNASETQIDLSVLNTGTYIIKIVSENQVKTIKVIKN